MLDVVAAVVVAIAVVVAAAVAVLPEVVIAAVLVGANVVVEVVVIAVLVVVVAQSCKFGWLAITDAPMATGHTRNRLVEASSAPS